MAGFEHESDQFEVVCSLVAQGYQHNDGKFWCAIGNTPNGKVAGKAKGGICYFGYGGKEC
jgi:hypothetical protein